MLKPLLRKCLPGNKILNKMGLSLLGNTISGAIYKMPESIQAIMDKYHFSQMLYQFASHVLEDNPLSDHIIKSLQKLGQDCAKYLQMKDYDCSSYTQVMQALCDLIIKEGMPQVSHRNKRVQQLTTCQSQKNTDSGHLCFRCLKATL